MYFASILQNYWLKMVVKKLSLPENFGTNSLVCKCCKLQTILVTFVRIGHCILGGFALSGFYFLVWRSAQFKMPLHILTIVVANYKIVSKEILFKLCQHFPFRGLPRGNLNIIDGWRWTAVPQVPNMTAVNDGWWWSKGPSNINDGHHQFSSEIFLKCIYIY
jgi:hypothetical protein